MAPRPLLARHSGGAGGIPAPPGWVCGAPTQPSSAPVAGQCLSPFGKNVPDCAATGGACRPPRAHDGAPQRGGAARTHTYTVHTYIAPRAFGCLCGRRRAIHHARGTDPVFRERVHLSFTAGRASPRLPRLPRLMLKAFRNSPFTLLWLTPRQTGTGGHSATATRAKIIQIRATTRINLECNH